MEQSPSESNIHSAIQEISRLLLNPKDHYHVHRIPRLAPILSQMNPVHTTPPHFPKIHSYITYHLRLGFPSVLFLSDVPTKIFYVPYVTYTRTV
jgi:hypothetical protein